MLFKLSQKLRAEDHKLLATDLKCLLWVGKKHIGQPKNTHQQTRKKYVAGKRKQGTRIADEVVVHGKRKTTLVLEMC